MNYAYYRSRFPLPVYRGPNPPEGEWMTASEAAEQLRPLGKTRPEKGENFGQVKNFRIFL